MNPTPRQKRSAYSSLPRIEHDGGLRPPHAVACSPLNQKRGLRPRIIITSVNHYLIVDHQNQKCSIYAQGYRASRHFLQSIHSQ